MRTQFLYVGLLSMLAGGLVGAAGCSDITAGQPTDPSGPPMLVHITIQDAVFVSSSIQRTHVTDLLDNTPNIACSDIQPCLTQFILGFTEPDFSCSCAGNMNAPDGSTFCGAGVTGTCNDPLKVPTRGVPIFTSLAADDPGDAGSGEQIRFVFSKVLDNSIETVAMDPTQLPGATDTYTLTPGIIELDDGKGVAVDSVTIYDNGGTPGINGNTPSDLLQVPLGPAIVLKPKAPLDPKTTYTLKLTTALLKDREGNSPVLSDPTGVSSSPLGAVYTKTFTTEDITVRGATSFPRTFPVPDAMTPAAQISSVDVMTFGFWEAVDPATVMIKSFMGPAGAVADNIDFFQNQTATPADPTSCPAGGASGPTGSLRVVYTTGPMTGMPAPWPAGTYTIDFTVQDRHHVSTYDTGAITFIVPAMCADGAATCAKNSDCCSNSCDPDALTCAADGHVASATVLTPEQCTGM